MTIFVLIIALAFAMVVTPLVRQLALHLNFVAVPKRDRLHRVATPLMGGVAVYISLIGALVLLAILMAVADTMDLDQTFTMTELLAVIASGTALAAVGLWDDWVDLNSRLKLALQFIPVVLLTTVGSISTHMPVPPLMNQLISVCWFLYVINAFNYTDNMDGIAGMIATVAGMFFTVIALLNDQVLLAALAAAVAGTSFGFLRFNLFHEREKIFMGDVGSMFLGFLLAVIGLKLSFPAASPWVTWPVPVLVLGVPIFDTALVFVSRWRRRQPFLWGGTDHLSHRLARMDLGRYGTPFAIGLLGSAMGCLALIVMETDLPNSLAAQSLAAVCALYLLYRLELSAPYHFITGRTEADDPAEIEVQSTTMAAKAEETTPAL